MNMGGNWRIHAFFSGKVQGVGFRNTCATLALEIGLTGWVRNLPDGRVELFAEGPMEVSGQLLSQLNTLFEITGMQVDPAKHVQEFSNFEVRR